ncbi:Batten's disease protein Cln3 [Botryosphaeria dothidea]|uniref:Batten's disease protein Cln3 n=1 Tax=Botryosphaeria dothidea TaxID=55169 RepID=A0A8H4IMC8_9PEZI|nr:Batten's disease protein Cln3 [Botryosphaeria dothidea]
MIESQVAPLAPPMVEEEKEASERILRSATTGLLDPPNKNPSNNLREWFKKDVIAFFIMGTAMALPTTILCTAAHSLFPGFTGAFMIVLAISAVATSGPMPLFLHFIPHNVRVLLIFVGSCISFFFCTLGHHIPPGQISGTSMAATVYAFATGSLLETAAFFDPKTVLAFNMGSSSSVLLGAPLFIGLMKAFNGDWKKVLLVCISTSAILPTVWFCMVSKSGRLAAEENRRSSNAARKSKRATNNSTPDPEATAGSPKEGATSGLSGFGPERTRTKLFWKVLFPRYVVPLAISTCLGVIALYGVVPCLMFLRAFKKVPQGELQYELSYLAYGTAQFLFSTISNICPLSNVWLWAALQTALVVISIVQLFEHFLTYFGVWIIFIFFHGGIIGASLTNTSYKIAEDFRENGEAEDVRAFAMSYGGLGSAVGDIVGGGLAIMVQRLAFMKLPVKVHM